MQGLVIEDNQTLHRVTIAVHGQSNLLGSLPRVHPAILTEIARCQSGPRFFASLDPRLPAAGIMWGVAR